MTPTIQLFILQPFYFVEYLILLAVSFRKWGSWGLGPQKLWLLMKAKTIGTHLTPQIPGEIYDPPAPMAFFYFQPTPQVHHPKKSAPPLNITGPPPGNIWLVPKIITLDLTRICCIQLSCKSIKLSVICSKSSLKSILKTRILCLSTSLVAYVLWTLEMK